MMKPRSLYLAFSFCLIMCLGCDTENDINSNRGFIKYFGTEGDQEGVDIVVGADDEIYLLGNSKIPSQSSQLYLVKCDRFGTVVWQRTFGNNDSARDLELTADGRLLILATSLSTGDRQAKLLIYSREGAPLDSVVYGYDNFDEDATSVTEIADGFIVTGSTTNVTQKANESSDDDVLDVFNFRFSRDLTPVVNFWNETLGPGTVDAGIKVIQVPGGFYFFGYSNKTAPGQSQPNLNFWVFPLNNFGNGNFLTGEEVFAGGLAGEKLGGVTLSPIESGEGFLLSGTVTDNSGRSSIYLAKLRRNLNFSSNSPEQVFQYDPGALDKDLGSAANDSLRSVKSFASNKSGFFILANDYAGGNSDFYLTKISNDGRLEWNSPEGFNFGGIGEDTIGAVAELADGSVLMLGTFNIGDQQGQNKMTLVKVSSDGKFRN